MPDGVLQSHADAEREARVQMAAHPLTARGARAPFRVVDGGLSNFSWRADVAGETWFVRLARRGTEALGADHRNECRVLHAVSAAGLAPDIVLCDPERRVLVTRWIEGVTNVQEEASPSEPTYLPALAAALARLHALAVPADLRRIDFAQRAGALEHELGMRSQSPEAAGRPSAERRERVHPAAVDTLQPVARQVFERLEHGAPASVLCHNDLNPTNIVTDPAGRPWLVDWEYAGLGDAALDLASCVSQHHLAPAPREAFLGQYRAAGGGLDPERFVLAAWGFDYVQWLWYRAFLRGAAPHAERISIERRVAALAESLCERASSLPHCNN